MSLNKCSKGSFIVIGPDNPVPDKSKVWTINPSWANNDPTSNIFEEVSQPGTRTIFPIGSIFQGLKMVKYNCYYVILFLMNFLWNANFFSVN